MRKRIRVRAGVAGVAGAALLALSTGSTYALWADQAAFGAAGDTIQTGDLRLEHSAEHADGIAHAGWVWAVDGVAVGGSPATSLGPDLVGGETITATTYVDATLIGTTLVATLIAPDGTDADLPHGITTSVAINDPIPVQMTNSHPGISVMVTITIPEIEPVPHGEVDSARVDLNFGSFTLELRQVVNPVGGN